MIVTQRVSCKEIIPRDKFVSFSNTIKGVKTVVMVMVVDRVFYFSLVRFGLLAFLRLHVLMLTILNLTHKTNR